MLKTQRPAGKQAQGLCRIDNSSPLLQYWQRISFLPSEYISIFHLPLLPLEDPLQKIYHMFIYFLLNVAQIFSNLLADQQKKLIREKRWCYQV